MKAWAVVDKKTETLIWLRIFASRQDARKRRWKFREHVRPEYKVVPVEITIIKKKVREK